MTALILQGDAAHIPLPEESVDLIVTSPPYFGLRSYTDGGEHYAGQIGSEATPREYIAALLECTREWVRILKPAGSIFVNLGDKYSGAGRGKNDSDGLTNPPEMRAARLRNSNRRQHLGLDIAPAKSLMGMPWRYALGCVDDLGPLLRAEIVWAKPGGLPESVTDRVRRSHEQVFHFTKQPRYYSAVDEVRETAVRTGPRKAAAAYVAGVAPQSAGHTGLADKANHALGTLPGSVWTIPSAPLTVPAHLGVDHFAAYPPELVRRIVLGWSPPGICTACGQGRRPVADTERTFDGEAIGPGSGGIFGEMKRESRNKGVGNYRFGSRTTITGYACACPDAKAPTRPAVVLDPFGGTGTTALVAAVFGRHGVTVDRSADYCRLAQWRTSDPAERARALGVLKPPVQVRGQESLFDGLEFGEAS